METNETTSNSSFTKPYLLGIGFIVISFLIYLLGDQNDDRSGIFTQVFFINYAFSVTYLVIVLLSKIRLRGPWPRISYGCWINLVILFTISAFSLNREMNVFARFPNWLNVYTLLSIPLFLVFPYYKNLPGFLKVLVTLLAGGSLTLSVYMLLYLLPLTPLAVLGMLVVGISIHTYVPAMWLWLLIDFIFRRIEKRKAWFIITGALIPIAFLVVYLCKWQSLQYQIKTSMAKQNIKLSNRLPNDIYLAQKLPGDVLTDEILVSSYRAQRFWGDGMWLNNEGSSRYHNPLSTIAIGLFGDLDIGRESVEHILNIRKDHRHKSAEKLWTGISLSTSAISTNIQVFPAYRMAYHEKTLMIHNDPRTHSRDAWFTSPTQEALYTFHVPEGSIVTSLSLWINGREQKSRLSTLQKADSAYKQVVGVERRDPAIVHWQEGNTVRVTVFPCTPNEERQFKIGFTTPLKVKDNKLCLENIWFEGPDGKQAQEVTQLMMGEAKAMGEVPAGFEKQANGNYLYEGDHIPYWKIDLDKPALSNNNFCFGGYKYELKEAQVQQERAELKTVFLDITNAWTKEEFESIVTALSGKQLYAWLPEKTAITKDNMELVWQTVGQDRFSVPFVYDVTEPASSAIITKGTYQSPILADLKQSDIADQFTSYLTNTQQKLNVLNIGDELSPFWRSLRELRLVNYNACKKEEAIQEIISGNMDHFAEDSLHIVISDSQLAISKTAVSDSLQSGQAPDHLLRVFAYNDLLRKVGRHYFEKEKYEEALFREAEEAYVVSPVTSMIVLENDADYDRLGIGKNHNTVGNASVAGGGAVPEPHEWLLIGLVALFITHQLYKRKKMSTTKA